MSYLTVLLLKIRDRYWFFLGNYISSENLPADHKFRFSVVFVPWGLLIWYLILWIMYHFLSIPWQLNYPLVMLATFPLASYLFVKYYKKIYTYLENYPVNPANDFGDWRNSIYAFGSFLIALAILAFIAWVLGPFS